MIILDNRIGSKHLQGKLEQDIPVSCERLEFGDVAFKSGEGQQIGIELKSAQEIIGQLFTPRFQGHQLPGLLDTYDWVYLVVEGLWKKDYRTAGILVPSGRAWLPIRYGERTPSFRQVIKFLNSLSILGNITVVCTDSQHETVEVILALYDWWQTPLRKHKSLSTFYAKPPEKFEFKKPSLFRRMMKEINGLGWEKTKLLEEKYQSVEQVYHATEEVLAQVPGIGKKLAKEIYESIR